MLNTVNPPQMPLRINSNCCQDALTESHRSSNRHLSHQLLTFLSLTHLWKPWTYKQSCPRRLVLWQAQLKGDNVWSNCHVWLWLHCPSLLQPATGHSRGLTRSFLPNVSLSHRHHLFWELPSPWHFFPNSCCHLCSHKC